jgi:hypothetical protein
MSTISEPRAAREPHKWTTVLTTEFWASLAISVMWIAVLFAVIYGPDFVSHEASGASTTIPSGIGVALFATIASWAVAKYAFGRRS